MGINLTSLAFECLTEKPKVPSHTEHLKSAKGFISKYRKKKRKERLRKLRRMMKKQPKQWKYKEYINSETWRKRRNEFFKKFGKKCAICKSNRLIGLHHISYERLGAEKDEDLVALCWEHHEQYHKQHGTKRKMTEETYKFITEEQEIEELSQLVKKLQ